MFLERFVYSILCFVFAMYVARKVLKTKSNWLIGLLGFQTIGLVVEILTFANGIYPDVKMRIYIFLINILIPSALIFLDYKKIDASELFLEEIGDYYMHKGKYQKAIAKYLKATEKKKNSNKLFVKLGTAYNAIGERRTAFDKFAKAVEIDRNDYKSYYEIGIIFNELGKKNDAQIVLDNTLFNGLAPYTGS